jgi:hypothetical protein
MSCIFISMQIEGILRGVNGGKAVRTWDGGKGDVGFHATITVTPA